MTGERILIVEDDAAIREMLGFVLVQAGFTPVGATDAGAAYERIKARHPDLILLDWMLPGLSGVEFARRLRRDALARDIPIILLTARGDEDDKITGLDAGADDYITKPFSPRELVARIRTVLRRIAPRDTDAPVEAAGLRLDPASHRVTAHENPVEMGPTEFRLLHFFMTHPERVFTRSELLDRVWGQDVYIEERTVDVHIRRLRKCLAPAGCDRLIQTVRGVGYRFSARA